MRFEPSLRHASCLVLAGLVLLGACDEGPASPGPRPDAGFLVTVYECTADVQAGTTRCQVRPSGSEGDGPTFDIIVGAESVSLTASGVVISNGDPANPDTTTLTWTLGNNLPQPIGTADGTTPHPNGTRAFFISGPNATAAVPSWTRPLKYLAVTADNALGPATFTSAQGQSWANRRYYQFDGLLAQGDSASTLVRFVHDSRVTAFTYQLLVATPVQYDHGWITIAPATAPVLAPGETTTLTATVYNHLGAIQSDALGWSSSDTMVATVDPSGVVTAMGQGTATITATSTINAQRTGTRVVTVDAVPAVSSTTPAHGSTGFLLTNNIVVVFTEQVSVSASSFSLGCSSGPQSFSVSGSGTGTITIDPVNSLPSGDTCTVTVVAAQVSDVDADDGPDTMAEDYGFSFQVFGFGGGF